MRKTVTRCRRQRRLKTNNIIEKNNKKKTYEKLKTKRRKGKL